MVHRYACRQNTYIPDTCKTSLKVKKIPKAIFPHFAMLRGEEQTLSLSYICRPATFTIVFQNVDETLLSSSVHSTIISQISSTGNSIMETHI